MKANYHTHCSFCDGADTAEAMAAAALERGLGALGFSSHSLWPFSSDWHLPSRGHGAYCAEVRRLREAYAGRMQVYLGFEADYVQGIATPTRERFAPFAPDYLIGAVHYVPVADGYFEADGGFADTRERIARYCGGDVRQAVRAYFACERAMLREGDFTFLAHCDLVRKQNSPKAPAPLFSEDEEWYRDELRETARAIASAGVCVEVNTGGMARGYLAEPYPSLEFLSLLHGHGVPITISSDAHRADCIDYGFAAAVEHARRAGYQEMLVFCEGALRAQPLGSFC